MPSSILHTSKNGSGHEMMSYRCEVINKSVASVSIFCIHLQNEKKKKKKVRNGRDRKDHL